MKLIFKVWKGSAILSELGLRAVKPVSKPKLPPSPSSAGSSCLVLGIPSTRPGLLSHSQLQVSMATDSVTVEPLKWSSHVAAREEYLRLIGRRMELHVN